MTRVMLLAQKPIGEKCFDLLYGHQSDGLKLVACVSNPSSDSVWWKSNGIYQRCKQYQIPFLSNTKRNTAEIEAAIIQYEVNLILSVQHNYILEPSTLALVQNNALNLHLAKLPDYKGYNAFSLAILRGDTNYTVTLHWILSQVDTGPIAIENEFTILPQDTAYSLYQKASQAGLNSFETLLRMLSRQETIPKYPQAPGGCFYARSCLNGLREIQNMQDQKEVDRKARAFYFPPFEPAYFYIGNSKYYVTPVYE